MVGHLNKYGVKKMQSLTFNTGRAYSMIGQPIFSVFDEERSVIAFLDPIREIEGVLHDCTIECFNQSYIMSKYDVGEYGFPMPWDAPAFAIIKMLDDSDV
jgi:hypothetical protein